MNITGWFKAVQEWVMSWFSDANKQKIFAILNGVKTLVDYALPIVKAIDEKLKPVLNDGAEDVVQAVRKFLEEYMDDLDKVLELADKLADLPMADMLANIALELLKTTSPTNASLSMLRLAVELAYNIYKTTK